MKKQYNTDEMNEASGSEMTPGYYRTQMLLQAKEQTRILNKIRGNVWVGFAMVATYFLIFKLQADFGGSEPGAWKIEFKNRTPSVPWVELPLFEE